MSEFDLSQVMPGWVSEGILGTGAFGTVYLARNTETGVFSAVKVIKTPPARESIENAVKLGIGRDLLSTYFGKFKNDLSWELTMYKTVKSRYLQTVEDIVTVDAQGPGWTGYVRTAIYTPMSTYFDKSPSTQEEAARMGVELASALDALAQYSMVHGELKPENVFVNDAGEFILGDFGIRRCLEKAGSGIFNPEEDVFEAPEVGEERRYTALSDIYSLGALMCYVANGCRMPSNRDPANIRGIDPALAAVIEKAMAADLQERYQTAAQVKTELERLDLGKKPPRRAMAAAAAFDAVKKNGGAPVTAGAVITGRGVTKETPGAAGEKTASGSSSAAAGAAGKKGGGKEKGSKAGLIVGLAALLVVAAVVTVIWFPRRSDPDSEENDPSKGSVLLPGDGQILDENGNPVDTPPSQNNDGDGTGDEPKDPGGDPGDDPDDPDGNTGDEPNDPGGDPGDDPDGPGGNTGDDPDGPGGDTGDDPDGPGGNTGDDPDGPHDPGSVSDDYIFASDRELLTHDDLVGLSQEQVKLALNELYARHGYIFKSEELAGYFEDQSWYTPVTDDQSKVTAQFNATEWANLKLITDYQREMGWRNGSSPASGQTPETESPQEQDTPREQDAPADPEPGTEEPGTEEPKTEDPGTEEPGTDEPGETIAPPESGYLFPSDRSLISRADLEGKSEEEVTLLINEIYARHGYIFSTAYIRDYFESCDWYTAVTNDISIVIGMLNSTETANVSFINDYMKEQGWR